MTALLMDIGNTRLQWGLLDDGAIRRTRHVSMGKIRDDVPAVRFQRPAALAESKFLVVSTPAAVSVAAINALAGAVERARHLMQADGYYAKVVLTGGDAARILMALEGQPAHRTHLVLHGLARLLENRR